MHDLDRVQLEDEEREQFIGPGARGQAGRSASARFAAAIKHLGFLPTAHFVQRLLQRAAAEKVRWDPKAFPSEFAKAKKFSQTRPGYNTHIAIVRGVPIMYRKGGRSGDKIVLITAYKPGDKLPPLVPLKGSQRELFEYENGGPYRTSSGPSAWQVLRRAASANRDLRAAQAAHALATSALEADVQRAIMSGDIRDVDPTIRAERVRAQARLDAALAEHRSAQAALQALRARSR